MRTAAGRLPAKWLVAGRQSPHYPLAAAIAGKATLAAHLARLAAMEAWDGRAALADIACPTLIIWGRLIGFILGPVCMGDSSGTHRVIWGFHCLGWTCCEKD